jgi:predicted permease
LVVTQVSIAFALLVGAGLMIASFVKTLQVDPGFQPENVLTASVALSPTRYTNEEQIRVAVKEIVDRVRAVPGVESTGAAEVIPFIGDMNSSVFTAADYVPKPGESLYSAPNSAATPGYFESMGIELVRGRLFNDTDTKGSQPVYVIDEWLANRFWPNQDPIGKQAFEGVRGIGMDDQIVMTTVVGIVKNVRLFGFSEDDPKGHYYIPHTQQPIRQFFLTVRTRVEPSTIASSLRSAVASFDPDLPAYNILTMKERMAESLAADRIRLFLLVGFASIALFLSGVGLYGVLAYTVAQRTSELGIRMALGSSAREVFGLVLKHGLKLTGIGLAIGLTASLALARLIRGLLFDVQPNDPLVFAGVLVVLAATATLACVLPARRATRIDPMVALQN